MTKPKKRTAKPSSKKLLEELQQKLKQKEEYLGCCEYSVEQFEANRSNNLVNYEELAESSKFCRWYLVSQKQYFDLHRSDYTASCKCVKAPQEIKIEISTLLVDSIVCTKESKKIVQKQCVETSGQLEKSEQDTSQCSEEFKEIVRKECGETSSQFETTQQDTSQGSEEFKEIVEKECVETSSQLEEAKPNAPQCSEEFKEIFEKECFETSSQLEESKPNPSQCSKEFNEIVEKECVETSSQLEESIPNASQCSEEFKEIVQNIEVNVCELNHGEGATTKDEKSDVFETVNSILESMVDKIENDEKM